MRIRKNSIDYSSVECKLVFRNQLLVCIIKNHLFWCNLKEYILLWKHLKCNISILCFRKLIKEKRDFQYNKCQNLNLIGNLYSWNTTNFFLNLYFFPFLYSFKEYFDFFIIKCSYLTKVYSFFNPAAYEIHRKFFSIFLINNYP